MYGKLTIGGRKFGISLLAATLAAGRDTGAAQEAAADKALPGWLGKEFTVESSTLNDHMPTGGKLPSSSTRRKTSCASARARPSSNGCRGAWTSPRPAA